MEKTEVKGRVITMREFDEDLKAGNFAKLFDYLKENMDKYNVTVRQDCLVLYSHGRRVAIKRANEVYTISFNFNNADALLAWNPKMVDKIAEELARYNFDMAGYEDWKENRGVYVSLPRRKRSKWKSEKGGIPEFEAVTSIPAEKIENYDFAGLLDTIYPIFESYCVNRAEENYRQECMIHYNTFVHDLVLFDVEYKPPFESAREKKRFEEMCKENEAGDKQFFKPDLVGLMREGNRYRVYFIELKVNSSSSIGKKANIKSHIIDWENYKFLYENSEYERKSFRNSVTYTLRLKSGYGLIDCKNIEEVIERIDFDEAPSLYIAVGLMDEMEEAFKAKLARKWNEDFAIWEGWNTGIVVGKNTPEILIGEIIPIRDYMNTSKVKSDGSLKERIYNTASLVYLDEVPSEVKKRLDSELAHIEAKDECALWEAICALSNRIEREDYPVIYDGYMADSSVAYLLGLAELDPVEYDFRPLNEKIARFIVPYEIRGDLIEYAQNLYGEQIAIEKHDGDEENIQGVQEVYQLVCSFSDVPIDLVVTTFPYQTVLAKFEDELANELGYTYDDEVILDYLHDEYNLPEAKTAIFELVKKGVSAMPEIHSTKTKVSLLYKLSLLSWFHTYDYYKTILATSLYRFKDLEEEIRSLERGSIDKQDTLQTELYAMYGDGFSLGLEKDQVYFVYEDGHKDPIAILDLPSLYPFDLKSEEER